jgi:hypothetical protein
MPGNKLAGNWEELFRNRSWRVAEELTGEIEDQGIKVTFKRGTFIIDAPGAFASPVSTNRGRAGIVLQEMTAMDGQDIPGSRMAFGVKAVERARKEFNAVA